MVETLLLIAAFSFPLLWLYTVWQGAPYRTSDEYAIRNMLELLRNIKGKQIAELGSGDGRIVIALAKSGAVVHGYEINPLLVLYSRWRIRRHGLNNATIHWRNFWHINLSEFNVIILFQLPYFLERLKPKLIKELHPEATIVSNVFKIPGWESVAHRDSTYLYTIAKLNNRK